MPTLGVERERVAESHPLHARVRSLFAFSEHRLQGKPLCKTPIGKLDLQYALVLLCIEVKGERIGFLAKFGNDPNNYPVVIRAAFACVACVQIAEFGGVSAILQYDLVWEHFDYRVCLACLRALWRPCSQECLFQWLRTNWTLQASEEDEEGDDSGGQGSPKRCHRVSLS